MELIRTAASPAILINKRHWFISDPRRTLLPQSKSPGDSQEAGGLTSENANYCKTNFSAKWFSLFNSGIYQGI